MTIYIGLFPSVRLIAHIIIAVAFVTLFGTFFKDNSKYIKHATVIQSHTLLKISASRTNLKQALKKLISLHKSLNIKEKKTHEGMNAA